MDARPGIEMVDLPPGQVTLSDRRTQHSWSVAVDAFQLAVVPITQSRYAQVTGQSPGETRGDRLPADSVSWDDAIRFCNALSEREDLTPAYRIDGEDVAWDSTADGYRLPTEAEWEYAFRAGTTRPRYGELDEIGWYRDNSEAIRRSDSMMWDFGSRAQRSADPV